MDLQYAWRGLRRTPGFSLLVILTLALGIGATTTAFSVLWAVFLRPLRFPEQDRLVTVWQVNPQSPDARLRVTPANFVDWEAQTSSFDALGVLPNWEGKAWPFNLGGQSGTERVEGIYASSGFFRVMGVQPLLGRALSQDDDRTRGRRSIVISHNYWQTRFASDPSIVGRTLDVDTFRGGLFTIVGVMPPGFDFPAGASIWLSLGDWGGGPMPLRDASERCCHWYTVLGRLKPASQSSGPRRAHRNRQARGRKHPDGRAPPMHVVTLRETLVGDHRLALFGLFGAVGCILLIGVANVANLLLARGVGRRREVLTRLAIGATRMRLARHLLTEGLLLGGVGATSAWSCRCGLRTLFARRWRSAYRSSRTLVWTGRAGVRHRPHGRRQRRVRIAAARRLASTEWSARGQTESRTSRRMRHGTRRWRGGSRRRRRCERRPSGENRGQPPGRDRRYRHDPELVVATDLTTSSLRERGSAARFIQEVIPRIAGWRVSVPSAPRRACPSKAEPAGRPSHARGSASTSRRVAAGRAYRRDPRLLSSDGHRRHARPAVRRRRSG